MFDSIRALFRKTDETRLTVDLNEIIRSVLRSLGSEAQERGVVIRTERAASLPRVVAHGGQLREVVFNLAHNAIDAMAATTKRTRLLQVRSTLRGDAIVVEVEDSGSGIDAKQLEGIF